LYAKAGYDPIGNFESVAMLEQISEVLIVNPTLDVKTLDDFVRLAKASPGKLTYSSSGNGSAQHLFMELFQRNDLDRKLRAELAGNRDLVKSIGLTID
jgi:tripartite-type tricarboxylate transporter receptor subunit TctC